MAQAGLPKCIRIPAKDRNNLPRGKLRAAPAGDCKEGCIHTSFQGQPFEFSDVRFARPRSVLQVFVLELDAKDRPAVFPEQSLQLLADLSEIAADVSEVTRVIGPEFGALLNEPVRKSAIAALAMGPGSNAHERVQPMRAAKFDEVAKIAPSRPIKLALDLFLVNPEDVRGDNLNSARLHFHKLVFPALLRITRKMELAHDRKPRGASQRQVLAIDPELAAAG